MRSRTTPIFEVANTSYGSQKVVLYAWRRALSCLLALALLFSAVPACAASPSDELVSYLQSLSDDELLELQSLVDKEVENRRGSESDVTDSVMVWIPKSGSKYHSKASCSRMKNPTYVTIEVAKKAGYTACSKCNPPE